MAKPIGNVQVQQHGSDALTGKPGQFPQPLDDQDEPVGRHATGDGEAERHQPVARTFSQRSMPARWVAPRKSHLIRPTCCETPGRVASCP